MEGGGAAAAPLDMHSFLYQTGRGAADAGSVQDRSLSRSLSSSAIVEPSAQGQGIASFELYMQQVQQGGGFFPGVKRTHTDPDVLLTRQVPADLSRWQQQEEQQQQQNQQQQQKEKELQQEAHEGEQQQQQPALENQQAFPFQDQEEFLQQLLEGVAAPQHPEEAATAAFMGEYSNHPGCSGLPLPTTNVSCPMEQNASGHTFFIPEHAELQDLDVGHVPFDSQIMHRNMALIQNGGCMLGMDEDYVADNEVGLSTSSKRGRGVHGHVGRTPNLRRKRLASDCDSGSGRGAGARGGGRGAGAASRSGRGPRPKKQPLQPTNGGPAGAEVTEEGDAERLSSTSRYRGVTRHKRSGRWEAHIWIKELKKQVYLGRYEQEEHAAEAYDVAALKTKKDGNLKTNFDVERYQDLSGCMHTISLEELIMAVRRQSQGHSRGSSSFRGVTSHPSGRWESRIGVPGSKHVYLGLFEEEIEAARAYDRSLVRLRGSNAATNFALNDYGKEMEEHCQASELSTQVGQPLESILDAQEYERWVKQGETVQQQEHVHEAPCTLDFSALQYTLPEQDYLAIANAAAISLGLPALAGMGASNTDIGDPLALGGHSTGPPLDSSPMQEAKAMERFLQQLGEAAAGMQQLPAEYASG